VLVVLGRREAEGRRVTLRRLGVEAQESLPLADAVAILAREAAPPDLRREPSPAREVA
jgi:threonyl-tRNA synthetase